MTGPPVKTNASLTMITVHKFEVKKQDKFQEIGHPGGGDG